MSIKPFFMWLVEALGVVHPDDQRAYQGRLFGEGIYVLATNNFKESK